VCARHGLANSRKTKPKTGVTLAEIFVIGRGVLQHITFYRTAYQKVRAASPSAAVTFFNAPGSHTTGAICQFDQLKFI